MAKFQISVPFTAELVFTVEAVDEAAVHDMWDSIDFDALLWSDSAGGLAVGDGAAIAWFGTDTIRWGEETIEKLSDEGAP